MNNLLIAHSSDTSNDTLEIGTEEDFIEIYLDSDQLGGPIGPRAHSGGNSERSVASPGRDLRQLADGRIETLPGRRARQLAVGLWRVPIGQRHFALVSRCGAAHLGQPG